MGLHLPVSPEVAVVATTQPRSLPGRVRRRVDELWERGLQRPTPLFDGLVFSLDHFRSDALGAVDRVAGAFVPYRWYFAGREDPALAEELGLTFMGVTGLLSCPDGLVLGRRTATAVDRGALELVPAGTLDDSCAGPEGVMDVRAHVLHELEEELGMTADALVGHPAPFAIVHDEASRVSDLGFRLETGLSGAEITATHRLLVRREHQHLYILGHADLGEVALIRRGVLPASVLLIEAAGRLAPGAP